MFTLIPGEMIQFDEHISQMGGNHRIPARSKCNDGRFVDGSIGEVVSRLAP